MTLPFGSGTRVGFEAFAETSNGPMAMLGLAVGLG
jgi:hypothetical protein